MEKCQLLCVYILSGGRGVRGVGVELVSFRTPKSLSHITGDFICCSPLFPSLIIHFLCLRSMIL
jgi:hypothetical protein